MFLKKIKFSFSLDSLAYMRMEQTEKLCYSKKLKFLNQRRAPTKILACIVMRRGNYLKQYLPFQQAYVSFLRTNCKGLSVDQYVIDLLLNRSPFPPQCQYVEYFTRFLSSRNLDQSLHWRGDQVQPLFRLELTHKKKTSTPWLRYIKKQQRILLVWRWFGLLLLHSKHSRISIAQVFYKQLQQFLFYHDNQFCLNPIKFKTYKYYLLKTYN